MFVSLSILTEGMPVVIEGGVSDLKVLEYRLGLQPVGEFRYRAVITLQDGGIIVSLSVKGEAFGSCDLCGNIAKVSCECDFDEEFDQNSSEYDPSRKGYDLGSLIDECITLSVPQLKRCKPDCKGLCPYCGIDLNKSECNCKNTVGAGNAFGVLKDIISTGGAKNGSTKK